MGLSVVLIKPVCAEILLVASLALVGPGHAYPQDFSANLENIENLAYAGSREKIREAIEELESELGEADARQRARFTLLKARALAIDGKITQVIELLDEFLDERATLEPDLELRALNLAADVLAVEDRFEESFDYFREALILAPGVNAPVARAETYSVAAGFHARIGEYSTAIEYANQAMAQGSSEETPRAHCVAHQRRAQAELGLERLEAALSDFRAAVEFCDAVPDLLHGGISRIGLATALHMTNQLGEAESTLRRAIDMLSSTGFADGQLEARYRLASLLLDQDRIDEARETMAPTMPWIDMPGSNAVRAAALRVHARLARAAQDQRAVYEYSRRAFEFNQQHDTRTRLMRFTLLMSAQDDRARKRELDLLRSRTELAELDREGRRQEELALRIGGLGAVVASILLIMLLVKAARDRRQFQRLSQRDGLTGLYNHTRFFELALPAFQRACQNATPFTLIVADIDLFKEINDQFGHLMGDSVLERIGLRLREAFEPNAIIGRLGGEEFGIALIDCDVDTAVARIEHFRATLNPRRNDRDEPSVTLSFGVAELSRERSLEVLYAHADQALYDAKDAGRNRVITVARIDLAADAFVT